MVGQAENSTNSDAFTIRPAELEDAGEIVRYMRRVLADRMASLSDLDEMQVNVYAQRDYLRRMESNPRALALLAECDDEVIGLLTIEAENRRKIGHVAGLGMSVREDWRRRGVGQALLEAAEEWARSTGDIRKLTLKVFSRNLAARKLYEKAGFAVEGVQKDQIRIDGEYQDLIYMAKSLVEK